MRSRTMKGINLGGWLVIEKWITPSLFTGTDARNEFELANTSRGRVRISKHHRTFITKPDLMWLEKQGIEVLRVPVGYWIFGDDKRYVGALDRLDWLMDTSLSLGLKVLIDLHAAPGAQNRAAHSGSGNTVLDKYSTKWLNDSVRQAETIEVLVRFAKRYGDSPALWGIELLNEPAVDRTGLRLARFYRRAYKEVVKHLNPGTRIVFSDGYAPLRLMNTLGLMAQKDYPAVLDTHIYQVFGAASQRRTFNKHVKRLHVIRWFLRFLRLPQRVIIGEWSAMLPVKTTPEQTRRYVDAQLAAFSTCEAQFYWTYKTEADGRWNYRDQVEKELIQ